MFLVFLGCELIVVCFSFFFFVNENIRLRSDDYMRDKWGLYVYL